MHPSTPLHRNWCFGAFRTIWVQLGPFCCLTKLGAKRAELVQKFVPRSRVGIFRNECTRSTPLDHKLMFWCDSYYLGAFGCHTNRGTKRAELVQKFEIASEFFAPKAPDPPHWTLNWCFGAFHTIWVYLGPFGCLTIIGAKRAELVQKSMQRSRVEIFRTERIRSTHYSLNWCFGTFCNIWVYLGSFGCLTKLSAKLVELVQMFVPKSRGGIFCNECTRCTPLDPKLMFWCVLYYLSAFGTVWFALRKSVQNGPN